MAGVRPDGPRGKVVKIHRGPAAVIGYERHNMPFLVNCVSRFAIAESWGEGVASRTIRKPENLPVIAVT